MGEAKRQAELRSRLVYHHTSTLRTNQLWMSGHLLPEGEMPAVLHPHLGEIQTSATLRRAMKDFPPLVWLTRRLEVPHVLLETLLILKNSKGVVVSETIDRDLSNGLALNRMAFGFDREEIGVVAWPDHPGYDTAEGRELNDTAREVGDDPDDWYVSERPIDLLKMAEVRFSRSVMKPKLERSDSYLADVKRMVAMCRERPDVFIPPSWIKPADVEKLARRMGLEMRTA